MPRGERPSINVSIDAETLIEELAADKGVHPNGGSAWNQNGKSFGGRRVTLVVTAAVVSSSHAFSGMF
jgi:hypothetical protein